MPRVNTYKREMERVIRLAVDQIIARYLFVDTLVVLARREVSSRDIQEVKRLNAGREVSQAPTIAFGFASRITLQKPTQAAVSFLASVIASHVVGRFDLALDLIVTDAEVAGELQAILRRILTQPHRGQRETSFVEGVTDYYSEEKWTSRNPVMYAHKPSKVTLGPALHCEFKMIGAATCRRYGFSHLDDFTNLDALQIIRRHVRFSGLNVDKFKSNLGWYVQGKRCRDRDKAYRRVLGYVARGLQYEEGTPSIEELRMQDIIDFARGWTDLRQTLENALIHLPIDPLVQGATWASAI